MSLFLEDVNDPEPTVYDRREAAEAYLDCCWALLEDEVECREDIARVMKLAKDVEEAIAELDELIDACDMADAAASERMWGDTVNLFDIKSSLYELLENGYNEECVDPDTGEFDEEKAKALLDGYQEEFACKVDGIAQYIQELNARADAIRNKAAVLTERARQTENKAEGLKRYLGEALGYKKYESDAVKIGFRKSVSVKVDESALPAEYFTVKEDRQPDKTAIKAALLGGAVISGATLDEKQNIQIK